MANPVVRRKMRSKRARNSQRRRGGRVAPIGLEVGIEPPDQPAHMLLGGALRIGERVELMHQASAWTQLASGEVLERRMAMT